jgi:hypothetical protein
MVLNFMVANLINNNNDVFFYDEQAQNKDVDALCKLQFTYHLEKFKTLLSRNVATPLLEECEDDIHTPEMGTWESSRTPKTLRVKTLRLEAFLISLESYRNVDVENGFT